jgi:hypothetical protein
MIYDGLMINLKNKKEQFPKVRANSDTHSIFSQFKVFKTSKLVV